MELFLKLRICDELKPKTLKCILGLGRTWVHNGRNYEKISLDPYFEHNFVFPKLLQVNLAYVAHPWFGTRSHLVYRTKTSNLSTLFHRVEGWISNS